MQEMTDYSYSFIDQIGSAVRRSPVRDIKACLKLAADHKLAITAKEIEAHHLAGGRIKDLMAALLFADEHHLPLSIRRARVQDLILKGKGSITDWVVDCHRRGVTDFEREPLS